jgi:MoaA/NifB/PqqE/SkfB family radical SAM enzyme
MRRVNQEWKGNNVVVTMRNAWRRVDWFTRDLSIAQMINGAIAAAGFALRLERLRSWPILVKIDISPACNLRCTYCVHASPSADMTGALAEQTFSNRQRMSVSEFTSIIRQIAGRSAAVALYYVGDPLMHPELATFCSIISNAGLNSHVSTNFSFNLSDRRLTAIVQSGLSHLTVCVDSMRQERYELTRVGGKIKLVLDNLERILRIRNASGLTRPHVEVQFIKYQHNIDEVDDAAEWCRRRGVDQFTEYWGNLHNYADLNPSDCHKGDPREAQLLPHCAWPWFAMQIKYDGNIIPCCYHRVGEQYRPNGDPRHVGHISRGIFEVWNSPEYRRLRRMASDPRGAQERENSFCQGCPVLFKDAASDRIILADATPWEQVYFRSASGEIVRRSSAP